MPLTLGSGETVGVRVPILRSERIRRRLPGGAAVAVILLVAFAATVLIGSAPAVASSASPSGPCPGPILGAQYTGSIAVLGGPPGAIATADVPLSFEGYLEVVVTNFSTGIVVSASCDAVHGTTASNATGAFSFAITPPGTSCTAPQNATTLCTTSTGPFGPILVTPMVPAPWGYLLSDSQSRAKFTVAFVALLAGVAFDPTGPTVIDAPTAALTVTTTPVNGEGAPSPISANETWRLSGPGWSYAAPPTNGSVTLAVAPGAGVGNLTVVTSAIIGGALWTAPPSSVRLITAHTAVQRATLNRTILDAGGSVRAIVNATGAPGFSYDSDFARGLGLPPITVPCTTAPSPTGLVAVECIANLSFPATGTTTPSVTVSNGYSSTTALLPPTTVTLPPSIAIAPVIPVGYVGEAVPLRVVAAPGFGATPFAGACLASGAGDDLCSTAPGPTWSFLPVYATPGNYTATGWVTDADGINRSSNATVRIVPPLAVAALAAIATGTVGGSIPLTSAIAGGDLPVAFWWNASDASDPIAQGISYVDGPLSASVVPGSVGIVRYSLTVVDRLGTVSETSGVVSIVPAPAATVRTLSGPPATPVVAGSGVLVGWEALDHEGGLVPSFSASVDVVLTGPAVAGLVLGWVNASGMGALPLVGPGTFAVPSDAWVGGILNLTVTIAKAGTVSIGLTGPSLPSSVAPVPMVVVPDVDHLRLFAPTVALAGVRVNHTAWQVRDRFGDPALGGEVVVTTTSPDGARAQLVPVFLAVDGTTQVWVNYSVGSAGATVRVLDEAGDLLLAPIVVPELALPAPAYAAFVPLGASVPIGAAFAGVAFVLGRRRSRAPSPRPLEDELRHLAEGRASVVEIVRRSDGATRTTLTSGWEPPPVPPDLDEWIASLVTDGTLALEPLPDGTPRWVLGRPPALPFRVMLDRAELDRAIAWRDAEATDEPGSPGS